MDFQFPNSNCLNQNSLEFASDLSLFMIHFDESDISSYQKEENLKNYLIVSDTDNHCIRLIDVKNKTVKTLIGKLISN